MQEVDQKQPRKRCRGFASTSQNLPVSLEEEDSGGSSTPCYGSKVETRDRPPGTSDLQPSSNMEVTPGPVLEVDLANKNVGGGALSHGAVQEVIMMVQLPEMIAARVFEERSNPSRENLQSAGEVLAWNRILIPVDRRVARNKKQQPCKIRCETRDFM